MAHLTLSVADFLLSMSSFILLPFYYFIHVYIILVIVCLPPRAGYIPEFMGRQSVIPTTECCLIINAYINRSVEDRRRPSSSMQNRGLSNIHDKKIIYSFFPFTLAMLKYSFTFFNTFCMKFHQYLEPCFLNVQFSLFLILLLLEAGDIASNPGPYPEQTLSILHLNIRSIRNKIDYLKDNFIEFEVLCFSETHLDKPKLSR